MKGLLRPLVVGGLSIAIAGVGLGNGRAALAAGNAAPTAVTVSVAPAVAVEGTDMVTATVTLDQPATEFLAVSLDWGDLTRGLSASFSVGEQIHQYTHTYADDVPLDTAQDQLEVSVLIESLTGSLTLTGTTSVTVQNAPPTMSGISVDPADITSGQSATVAGSFADAGSDRHQVTVTWGDGTSFTSLWLSGLTRSFLYTHTYTAGGDLTVTARVTDDDTGFVEASAPIKVRTLNQAPTDLGFSVIAVEGSTAKLDGSFADLDTGDTHTVVVDWGDGSTAQTLPTVAAGLTQFASTHVYVDTKTRTVTVELSDNAGHSISTSVDVTPTNVAPSVSLAVPASPVAGDNVDLGGTFTDPGAADTFTLSVVWGDGTANGTPVLGADGRSFSASHTYASAGSFSAAFTVTDGDGAPGTASALVVVRPRNVPPTGLTLVAPTVAQGSTTTVTGTFSDTDGSDTHSVVLTWGDGSPPATLSLARGTTSFTATHGYATAGSYTVSGTVSDPAGASSSATTQAVVTAPTTTAALLDQLSALVQSFDLNRVAERWLLHRIDELKDSLADGNEELCEAVHGLDRLSSVAHRVLTSEQAAALADLTTKLEASVQCSKASADADDHRPAVLGNTETPAAHHEDPDENDNEKDHHEKDATAKSDDDDRHGSDSGDSRRGDRHSRAND